MVTKITIETVTDLKKNFGLRNVFSYPMEFDILIQQITEADRIAYKQKILKQTSQCGCESGQQFVLIFVLLYIVFCFLPIKLPTKNHIVNFVIFAFVGAFVGKLFGLIKARIGLNNIIQEIEYKLISAK